MVCASGAALANMLYMPPGARIIGLVSSFAIQIPGDIYFDALAKSCGHDFSWLPGRPTRSDGPRLIDADYEIDPDELARLVGN